MTVLEESENRLIARHLTGLLLILDGDHVRLVKQIEPLLYRRLRDQCKRAGGTDFSYADALGGLLYEDSFDPSLGPMRQGQMAAALITIVKGITMQSRSLDWIAKKLEERINRRIKDPMVYMNVELA